MAFHPPPSAIRCYWCQKPVRKGAVHARCQKAGIKRSEAANDRAKNYRPMWKDLIETYWIYPGERRQGIDQG